MMVTKRTNIIVVIPTAGDQAQYHSYIRNSIFVVLGTQRGNVQDRVQETPHCGQVLRPARSPRVQHFLSHDPAAWMARDLPLSLRLIHAACHVAFFLITGLYHNTYYFGRIRKPSRLARRFGVEAVSSDPRRVIQSRTGWFEGGSCICII